MSFNGGGDIDNLRARLEAELEARHDAHAEWMAERNSPPDDELPPLEAYEDEPAAMPRTLNGRAKEPQKAQSEGWTAPTFVAYGASFDPAQIPLRRWLIGNRRSIGEMTLDAGPPGVNKSTLMLTDAVAITTGRKILNDEVHETGAVLYLAGEDARRDVEARLAGILKFYEIEPAELGDRLHVLYLGEVDATTYTLAQMAEDVAALNLQMLGWLRDLPDTIAVFIDPLMAWHRLMENSNEAVQILSTAMRAIAVQGKRHVGIDHHVTKVTMGDPEGHVGNLASVRGAGSLIGATRWAFTLARLNAETAMVHGIPEVERSRYRRLDALKTSYGPDGEQMRLLRVESVTIGNGESVPVLVEQDLEIVQGEAKERKAAIQRAAQDRLAAALAKMLTEQRPRTANAAALWLITHAPELVAGKKGETLSEFTVRRKLPAMIGTGLWAPVDGKRVRIVMRATPGRGNGSEITFAQPEGTP
ncbi:MAG: AAA family ATPase [Steroidobacteraceae bacterium]